MEHRLKCYNPECDSQEIWICEDDTTPCPYCGKVMSKPTKWQDSDRVKCLLEEIELLSEELEIRLGGYLYIYRLPENKLIWGGKPANVTTNG